MMPNYRDLPMVDAAPFQDFLRRLKEQQFDTMGELAKYIGVDERRLRNVMAQERLSLELVDRWAVKLNRWDLVSRLYPCQEAA